MIPFVYIGEYICLCVSTYMYMHIPGGYIQSTDLYVYRLTELSLQPPIKLHSLLAPPTTPPPHAEGAPPTEYDGDDDEAHGEPGSDPEQVEGGEKCRHTKEGHPHEHNEVGPYHCGQVYQVTGEFIVFDVIVDQIVLQEGERVRVRAREREGERERSEACVTTSECLSQFHPHCCYNNKLWCRLAPNSMACI